MTKIMSMISLAAVMLLGACQPIKGNTDTVSPSSPLIASPALSTSVPSSLKDMIKQTSENLANLLSIPLAEVVLVDAAKVEWPDSSLGCPRPGEVYAQQTVPGYRLLLEVNNQEYTYHTDTKGTVILCQDADLPSFPITPGEIDDGEPWMPVD